MKALVQVILASTREQRVGEKVARWFMGVASALKSAREAPAPA